MMGVSQMNGAVNQPQVSQPLPLGVGMDTPIAYYKPIEITPGLIKWFMGCTVALMGFLASAPMAERYLNPAKQSDLAVIQEIVKTLQTGQSEQRVALDRVVLALDNLSGLVAGMQQTARAVVPRSKSLAIGR